MEQLIGAALPVICNIEGHEVKMLLCDLGNNAKKNSSNRSTKLPFCIAFRILQSDYVSHAVNVTH